MSGTATKAWCQPDPFLPMQSPSSNTGLQRKQASGPRGQTGRQAGTPVPSGYLQSGRGVRHRELDSVFLGRGVCEVVGRYVSESVSPICE